jgi:hypothetical protein
MFEEFIADSSRSAKFFAEDRRRKRSSAGTDFADQQRVSWEVFVMTFEQFEQLVARLAPISQILASVGVLFGILTAILGFRRYLAEKARDRAQQDKEYLSALRKSIFISRPIFTELNRLLRYELFYEMTLSVADSKPMDIVINKLYDLSRNVRNYNASTDGISYDLYLLGGEISKSLQDALQSKLNEASFPENPRVRITTDRPKVYLGVPVRMKLVELFETYTNTIGQEIEPYRFDYPSLSRVLLSANYFFASLEDKYRLYARDIDHWTNSIVDVWSSSFSDFLTYPPQDLGADAVQNSSRERPSEEQSSEEQSSEERPSEEQSSEERPSEEQSTQNPIADAVQEIMQSLTSVTPQGTSPDLRDKINQDITYELASIQSVDEFKDRVTQRIVSDWYYYNYSQDAEAIDAVLAIVQIVTKTYLSKTNEELVSIREHEQDIDFAPIEQTPRPEQMLQEAYNGLRPVLSDFDRDSYHDFAQKIASSRD